MSVRSLLLLLALLLSACVGVEGPAGNPGPPGPAGSSGKAGPPGAPGLDAVQSGSRLTARWIVGEDESRLPTGDFHDEDRDEVCAFRVHDGELRCMPPELAATEWHTWVDPTCTGDRGFTRLFAPAAHPEGSSIVRVLSNDPTYHGTLLMRGEEVPGLFYKGPADDQPCQPFVAGGDGFLPPYYRWPTLDPEAFVRGFITP